MKPIIHLAPDIGYLFPDNRDTAKTLCGRLAKEVMASGEFIGIAGNLNPTCEACSECLAKLAEML